MNIKQDLSSVSSKIIAILAIGAAALAVYLLVIPNNEEETVAQAVLTDQSPNVTTKASVKNPEVTFPAVEKQAIVRNPFTIPTEYLESKDNKTPASQQPLPETRSIDPLANGLTPTVVADLPKLSVTGIASGDDGQQLAVINDGKQSRAYRLGEWIGAYQVEEIGVDAVAFSGPAGKIVLPVANNIKTEKSMAKERIGSGNDSVHNLLAQ